MRCQHASVAVLTALAVLALPTRVLATPGAEGPVTVTTPTTSTTVTVPDVAFDPGDTPTATALPPPKPKPTSAPTPDADAGRAPSEAASRSEETRPALAARTAVVAPDAPTAQSVGVGIVEAARALIGIPYVYAGDSPSEGFDCSGLVVYVYSEFGIAMPRTSQEQGHVGVVTDDPRPGDLVWWSYGHVAIYAGNGMMIESPVPGETVREVPVRDHTAYIHVPALDTLTAKVLPR